MPAQAVILAVNQVIINKYVLYGIVFFAVMMFAALILYHLQMKKVAPEAFVFRDAAKLKRPVVMVHYPDSNVDFDIPTIAEEEKDLGTPYWEVKRVGIKFRDPSGRAVERIGGRVPMYHYFMNSPAPLGMAEVVAYSQLSDYFKSIGMAMDNVESTILYVLAENEKHGEETAIGNTKITSDETKKHIQKYLDVVKKNRNAIENQKLTSGIFTFQTAMRALDSTMAFTSAQAQHMKAVVRTAILRQEEDKSKRQRELIIYGIVCFIVAMAVIALMIVAKRVYS